MTHDSRCYDLAHIFLSDLKGVTEKDITQLAEDIQQQCEDMCREIEERAVKALEQT